MLHGVWFYAEAAFWSVKMHEDAKKNKFEEGSFD